MQLSRKISPLEEIKIERIPNHLHIELLKETEELVYDTTVSIANRKKY